MFFMYFGYEPTTKNKYELTIQQIHSVDLD